MFDYTICTVADEEIFEKQCAALEKHVPNLKFVVQAEDVDGSKLKRYEKDGKKIVVRNSMYIDAVIVNSEIELEQFFNTAG